MAPKYPFQPGTLDSLPERIAEMFRGLENRLLQEICSRLKIAGELNEVTVQAIRSLRALGGDLAEIESLIAEMTATTQAELDALLDEVVARNEQYAQRFLTMAEITAPGYIVSNADIEIIRTQTRGALQNITQTMGFAIRQGGKIIELTQPAQTLYKILDAAELDALAGTVNYQTAIERATRELADSGLKKIEYTNDGRRLLTQADVAARRAILTGVSQINNRYTDNLAENLGTDLFEVSAHSGARNTGDGWKNHAKWQGKVYSMDGDTPKYQNIKRVCGLGAVDGLGGANCRHRYFPFVDGISERAYTDEQLKNIDQVPIKYQDIEYDQYHAEQKQREIERTIRKYKRRKTAAEAAGLTDDATAAGARIRQLNALYKDFSNAANLPMQKERMKVLYPD